MAVVTPVFYGVNRLESAVLTMTPDGAASGKGTERLVDRDIGLECEDQGTSGTRRWHADHGSAVSVEQAIFIGSNIAGETIVLESSTDNSSWTSRGSVVPAANDVATVLAVTGAPVSARYWRWSVTDPAEPLRFTEVFLTAASSLTFKPSGPSLTEPVNANVTLLTSVSGRSWGVKRGTRRWSATYTMTYSPDADRLALMTLLSAIEDGAKPFWFRTVLDEVKWVRLTGSINFIAADRTVASWDIPLDLSEELP